MNQTGMKTSSPGRLAIMAGMFCIYFFWGTTFLAMRFAIETIPPFLMAGIRFILAGGMLYLWQRFRGDPAPTMRQFRSAAIAGIFMLTFGNGSIAWAEQRVPSGIAAIMVASSPLWITIIDTWVLRKKDGVSRPNLLTMLGILLGFGGIILLVGPAKLTGLEGQIDPAGAVALSLAALSWSIGSLYSRGADMTSSPLLATSMEMIGGGIALLAVGTITGQWSAFNPSTFSLRSMLSFVYLIIFGSVVGFGAYTWLLKVAPISLVSTFAYVNPLVAIFIGNWLGQEPITSRVLLSAVIIIGSVAFITLTQRKPQKGQAAVLTSQEDHQACTTEGHSD